MINENIVLLNEVSEESISSDKKEITIAKLNEMKYSAKTFNDDIIKLYELKTGIL